MWTEICDQPIIDKNSPYFLVSFEFRDGQFMEPSWVWVGNNGKPSEKPPTPKVDRRAPSTRIQGNNFQKANRDQIGREFGETFQLTDMLEPELETGNGEYM